MENFAIRIDENVRLRLYKICRLCGDDNPNNTDILASHKKSTNVDPDFHKKIFECVGIQVTKGDRMPQTACNTCHEKINDFHEFREMCLATDVQTRRLLGLPDTVTTKSDPAQDVEDDKTEVEKTIRKKNPAAVKASAKNQKLVKAEKKALLDIKRSVKAEREKTNSRFRKKVQIQAPPPETVKKKFKAEPERLAKAKKRKASGDLLTEKPPNKRERHRENIIRKHKIPNIALDEEPTNVFCSICNKGFCNAGELHRHLDTDHLPRVVAFHCVRCDESIEKKQDIKNHTLWHKLSKTPYECGRCGSLVQSLGFYTKHLTVCSVFIQEFEYKTKKCETCNEEFETQNLYNWHKCIINQLKCEVCQQKFSKKSAMVRHVVRCTAVSLSTSLPVVDSALEPDLEPDVEPEPEPDMNDHFADGMSNDDASDTEMNLKPNLEIDIEVPRKERQAKVMQPSTPFVIIPSSVANTNRTDRNSTAAEKLPAPTAFEANSLTTIQNNDSLAANALAKSLPMVRIKLEPIGNIINKSSSKTSAANDSRPLNSPNTSISVRVKAEMIDPEYRDLHESNLNRRVKKEPNTEREQQLPLSDIGNSELGASDPLDVSCSDVPNDSSKAPIPSLPDQRTEESLPLPIAKPTLKLVIKKQHGTLNSSFVDGSTVLRDNVEPEPKKKKKKKSKIFKIPKELAMRIKQEKLCTEVYNSNVTSSPSNEEGGQQLPLTALNEVRSNKSASKSHRKDGKHANINPMNPANLTLTPLRIKEEKLDDGYERRSIDTNSGKEVERDLTASTRQLPDNSSNNTSNNGLNSVRIKQELFDYADKTEDILPVRIKQELVENNPLEMPESIIPVTIKPEPIDVTDTDAVEELPALPVISEVRSNAADEQLPDDNACQRIVSRAADVESQSTLSTELTLRIANVSSGNDVLECVRSPAKNVKKSPEKLGNREPKRFPMLRIKSEFSSFNFSNPAPTHVESSTNKESISNGTASTQVKEEPQDIPEESFDDNSITECMSEQNDDANVRIKVELAEQTVAPTLSNIPDEGMCGQGSELETNISGTRVKVEPEGEVSSFGESSENNNNACAVNRVKTERQDTDDDELNGEHVNLIRSVQIKAELSYPVVIKTEEDNEFSIKNEPSDCTMSFTTESELEGQVLEKETNSSAINEPTNLVDVPSLLISRVESFKTNENDSVSANEEEDLLRPIKHEPFYERFDQHPRNLFDVENSNTHFEQQTGFTVRVQSFAALKEQQEFTAREKDRNVLPLLDATSIAEEDDLFDSGNIVIKSEPSETVFLENRHQMSPHCNEVANSYNDDISSGASCGKDEDHIRVKELGEENFPNSRESDVENIEVSEGVLQATPKDFEKHRIDSEDAMNNQINNSALDSDDAGQKVCIENPLFGKGDNQSQITTRNEDDEASETENAKTLILSFDSAQNNPSVTEEKLNENEKVEVNKDDSEEVPNKSQTEISPSQSTDNVAENDTKLTDASENEMLRSPKIPLSKDDDCAEMDTEDNSSHYANNLVQHSGITISEHASLSHDDQDSISNLEEDESVIASDCNQKLKDLIQDKDHLLGFFEDELSRNCDSVPDELGLTKNTKISEEESDVGQNTELLSALPSNELSGEPMTCSEKTEEANNVSMPPDASTLDERQDDALDACFRREAIETKVSVSAKTSGLPMTNNTATNHTAILAEKLVTFQDGYDAPHAKVENSGSNSPPPLQNNSVPTTNTPLSSSTSPSCNLLNPPLVPSIISLPKAIVSPSISPSSSSYNTLHVSGLGSSPAPSVVGVPGMIPSVDSRSASIKNEDSTITTSSNSLNPANEPESLFPYPNADQLESNLYSSTSQMNMLHINEIAENNNNANIERELQNDLDSISSNSNLGFEDAAGPSRNEIPEEVRAPSTNGRNCNVSDH